MSQWTENDLNKIGIGYAGIGKSPHEVLNISDNICKLENLPNEITETISYLNDTLDFEITTSDEGEIDLGTSFQQAVGIVNKLGRVYKDMKPVTESLFTKGTEVGCVGHLGVILGSCVLTHFNIIWLFHSFHKLHTVSLLNSRCLHLRNLARICARWRNEGVDDMATISNNALMSTFHHNNYMFYMQNTLWFQLCWKKMLVITVPWKRMHKSLRENTLLDINITLLSVIKLNEILHFPKLAMIRGCLYSFICFLSLFIYSFTSV